MFLEIKAWDFQNYFKMFFASIAYYFVRFFINTSTFKCQNHCNIQTWLLSIVQAEFFLQKLYANIKKVIKSFEFPFAATIGFCKTNGPIKRCLVARYKRSSYLKPQSFTQPNSRSHHHQKMQIWFFMAFHALTKFEREEEQTLKKQISFEIPLKTV